MTACGGGVLEVDRGGGSWQRERAVGVALVTVSAGRAEVVKVIVARASPTLTRTREEEWY